MGPLRQLTISLVFCVYFASFIPCSAISPVRFRDPVTWTREKLGFTTLQATQPTVPYKWSEEWLEGTPVDHFSFGDNRTFSLRYFINTDHTVDNGPIFFYTGNEGDLEGFATNTGFMWDIAPEFNATIVFAEHRFYGKSKPFGNQSYSNLANLGYLSSEQALADFAQLIDHLKRVRLPNAKNSSVIAFGGSYGGMLTAWLRIKYPHLVDGGIAASAPVYWFRQSLAGSEDVFDRIVTRTFRTSGCNSKSVSASFAAIRQLASTEEGRAFINTNFHLANESQLQKPEDADSLLQGIQSVMETLAMVDYPYEANFLGPLPAWPVKVACRNFTSKGFLKKTPEEAAMASYAVLNLFYNYTGHARELCVTANCPGPFSQLGDPNGWPWQTCTEMAMPMCSKGPPTDFFANNCPWGVEQEKSYCRAIFSNIGYCDNLLRPDWVLLNYGAHFPTATNIVFSNGYLDPWSGGGWSLKPATHGSLVGLIVEDGAHHYDLRGKHPKDTDSVKEVRMIEKIHIRRWIREHAKKLNREHKKHGGLHQYQ